MRSHIIRLFPLGKEIRVIHNTPLTDVLHEFGIEFPCGGNGTCGKCKIRLLEGNIEISGAHSLHLKKLMLPSDWRLACYSSCTQDITLEIEQFNHLILADESEFEFTPCEGFGIAVDLGTTTIVAQLLDLKIGRVLAAETLLNPQVKYGADLISRIQSCLDGKAAEMTFLIRTTTRDMIKKMLQKNAVSPQRIVLVGNTAMQLIFSGGDVTPLSTYPFEAYNIGMKTFRPDELGWDFEVVGEVVFYPSIGSFVGSDILAGIMAAGIHKKESYTALIDLGTNGEIVIGNRNGMVCASTAAGPAFEGSNISVGMRAVTGAISSLKLSGGKVEASVIGNIAPKGICGSALIDAVAILRHQNLIGMFGEITSGESKISLTGKIQLSQKDINEFQLAKAALAAGMEILTKNLGIGLTQIETVYIAGGFGTYINIDNVVATGMIEVPGEKIRKMGNTALIGAKMFLFKNDEIVNDILFKTRHINLESDPRFQDIYVGKMMLI